MTDGDSRSYDEAGQPILNFGGMEGGDENQGKPDANDKKDFSLEFHDMEKSEEELRVEKERELSDPGAVSVERFGEQRLTELNDVLKNICTPEEFAEIGESGLQNDPTYIGKLLEYEPRLERLLKSVEGVDLTHAVNRDKMLRFKGDLDELKAEAFMEARSAVGQRHGGAPGSFSSDVE